MVSLMNGDPKDSDFTEDEIALRMNNAVRRALSTPPKSLKERIGKSGSQTKKPKGRVRKAPRSKPECP